MDKAGSKVPRIAYVLNVNERTICRILKKYKERGSLEPKKGGDRSRKLTDRDVRAAVAIIKKNRCATLSEITQSIPTKVHENTLR
jgi:transposase